MVDVNELWHPASTVYDLGQIDDQLCVSASSNGDLQFSVKTDMVTVSTQYKKLKLSSRS